MEYSTLLLSSGGGIISAKQRGQQVKGTATILIGLGGTGVHAIRMIKSQVHSRLNPDRSEAGIDEYEHIRFIGVDTAEQSFQGMLTQDPSAEDKTDVRGLLSTETFSIGSGNISAVVDGARYARTHEYDWLDPAVPIPDLGRAGAGGIRQIGRLLMMQKSDAFIAKLKDEIDAAKKGLGACRVNVHIFSGLSGGTGSGCFLDVCYMVRSVVGSDAALFGYFFLPDVNLYNIKQDDDVTRTMIKSNGYAAMQELDYCMGLPANGGSFRQVYLGSAPIPWRQPPVQMCHLISATNEDGDVIPNAYEYAMHVVAEYVMDFLTAKNDPFDLQQHRSNFVADVATANGTKTIGSNLSYLVIGAACARLPIREINTYLASELFGRFGPDAARLPTAEETLSLTASALAKGHRNLEDIYEELTREIRRDAGENYEPFPEGFGWKYVRDHSDASFGAHYDTQSADKKGNIEKNAQSMMDEKNEDSLIMRVCSQLESVVCDKNRGPAFAAGILAGSKSDNMLNILDGLLKINEERWEYAQRQHTQRIEEYRTAREDFFRRPKSRRFESLEFYREKLERSEVSLEVFARLKKVLSRLKTQVEAKHSTFYGKLADVTGNLMETFRANKTALNGQEMVFDDPFAVPLVTVDELRPILIRNVEERSIPTLFGKFMGMMLRNEDAWLTENEYMICRVVTDFFENEFMDFAGRSITEFLRDKYLMSEMRALTDAELAEKIYTDWMLPLAEKAKPMFKRDDSVWRLGCMARYSNLSYPDTSHPIQLAAKKMNQPTNGSWSIHSGHLTDRIYFMRSDCVLPLASYSNCSEYERVSFGSKVNGRHIYCGNRQEGMAFSNWYRLPSLTPVSYLKLREDVPDALRRQAKEAETLYNEALRYGVIKVVEENDTSDGKAFVFTPVAADLQRLTRLCDDCEAALASMSSAADAVNMENRKKLLADSEIRMIKTEISLPNDGLQTEEIVSDVRLDHFGYSPVIRMTVRKALDDLIGVRSRAERLIGLCDERRAKLSEAAAQTKEFFNALFLGVFSVVGNSIQYEEQTALGALAPIPLSRMGDAFPFGDISPYQAYLSYCAMSREQKNGIKKAAQDRMNSNSPEILTAGTSLKSYLTDTRFRGWAGIAENYAEKPEIIGFLTNLMVAFGNHCLVYAIP